MSKRAWCSECGRYVVLTPEGLCPNGHRKPSLHRVEEVAESVPAARLKASSDSDNLRPWTRDPRLLVVGGSVLLAGIVLVAALTLQPSPQEVSEYLKLALANARTLVRTLGPWALALNLACGVVTELLCDDISRPRVQLSFVVCSAAALVPAFVVVRAVGDRLSIGLPAGSPASDVPVMLLFFTAMMLFALVAESSDLPKQAAGCFATGGLVLLVGLFRILYRDHWSAPIDIRVLFVAASYVLVVMSPQAWVARTGDRWRFRFGWLARLLSELGLAAVMLVGVCLVAGTVLVYAGL